MIFFDSTVFLVDDDLGVLQAMSRVLRAAAFRVVPFASPREFLDEHDPSAPGCLVLDLAMPDLDGLEIQQLLSNAGETLPIIFLSGQASVLASVRAMKQGAADFLLKPVERDELVRAVSAAIARDQAARAAREHLSEIRRRVDTLTPREFEVFQHVISGRLNKQTAAELGAAEKTIKIHRGRVMEKMRVESVAELVRLAEQVGIAPCVPDR